MERFWQGQIGEKIVPLPFIFLLLMIRKIGLFWVTFSAAGPFEGKGGFPLSRKFYVRAEVNLAGFTYVNEIRSDV